MLQIPYREKWSGLPDYVKDGIQTAQNGYWNEIRQALII